MNWYFVQDGLVVLRSPDDVPDSFNHPTKGAISNLRALIWSERSEIGWLPGTATERPAFDARTQKASIKPRVDGSIVIEEWVIEQLTDTELAAVKNQAFAEVNWKRDAYLQRTDFLMLSDAPIDDATRAAWVSYRQALRDLPKKYSDPRDVLFPTPPVVPALGL